MRKYISKIKNVLHDKFMNHSFMPFKFHQKCIVISLSCFPSLIAVCFGRDLFANHHESDCKINKVLQCECAKWHYGSVFQPCPLLPETKVFIEPMKWQSKKSLSHLSYALLNQPCLQAFEAKKNQSQLFRNATKSILSFLIRILK